MYQKIKKSEDNSNKIKCKDNGVFDSLCVVTSAGIDDKLFMATAINSIDTKQQGVTEIYHKEKNITSSNVSLAKEVPEMKSEGNGVVGGARDFMSKRFHPKPNRTNDVDAPTFTLGDKKKYKQVNKDSMFEMCNEVVRHPASLEEQDTDRPIVNSGFPNHNENHVPPVNGSVIINENQQSIFASVDVDFAKRFRRSNNPSVRELKEMEVISMLTVPSNIDLLQRIADEEELILDYDIFECCPLTIRKNFTGIQLTINHCGLTVVGFGETILESQENAAHECLMRFKSILEN
ncbi:uncharacterized protein LOC112680569 [Sipha flava]|uniref:Uncharacterized protein LOC112680569 n=1 Tax=Sipha flava TaxID=143950 RepID=A0A8B8F825_9HEMI|nr:uncharacterized protein LOC112680569 [Sipha flava]